MKLIELFADKLLDTPIMEMAVKRKKAIEQVTRKKYQIAMHFIKLIIFNDQAKNHWISELKNWINELDQLELKPNSTRLAGKVYFEILFNEFYGHGTSVLAKQIRTLLQDPEYKNCQRTEISIPEVHSKLKQIYAKLCKDLGNDTLLGMEHYLE